MLSKVSKKQLLKTIAIYETKQPLLLLEENCDEAHKEEGHKILWYSRNFR